jgi:hypothetical protein
VSDTKISASWFLARNGGQARLQHATEKPGDMLTLCGLYVGYWTRWHMNYVAGFACKKCARRAGLVEQSKAIRILRSVS